MSVPEPCRFFFDWAEPLLPQLCRFIESLDDPSSAMVVVPTANSGRRLRQALAERAAADASVGAVFPPRVVTPESFFRPSAPNVASRAELLVAWANVLRAIPSGDADKLFPESEGSRTFSWGMRAAKPLVTTCESVAEADRDLADVAGMSDEPQRWIQLAKLESEVADYLAERGRVLPSQAKRETAGAALVADGVDHVVIAGVPDPVPLAVAAWSRLTVKVSVIVHAPESMADRFDHWGRPLAADWSSSLVDLPGGNDAITLSADADGVADEVIGHFAANGAASDRCAVGICDADYSVAVRDRLSSGGWCAFDPNGQSVSASGLVSWLGLWRELVGPRPSFGVASELLKAGESQVLSDTAGSFALACDLDRLRDQFIPESVGRAAALAGENSAPALAAVSDVLASVNERGAATTMLEIVGRMAESGYNDGNDGDVLSAVMDALDECAVLESNGELTGGAEALDLVGEILRGARVADTREDVVIDLQGWLELAYDPAPHMSLVGVHEGVVPENLNEDAFLPESLRRKLGLRDRDQRMARDSYLLSALAMSRRGDGRSLVCHLAKASPTGDPRTPSRLVMRCTDDELPARVAHCFAELGEDGKVIAEWQRGDWMLNVPSVDNPYAGDDGRAFSPSSLRSYLSCPFRFYLEKLVVMQRVDVKKRELDAGQFGTLVHAVLDAFGKDGDARDWDDAGEIASWLSDALDDLVAQQLGSQLTLPVMAQVESARERLKTFASVQASERAAGWQIIATEMKVTGWMAQGVPMNMVIDRVDRHDGGQLRVMDYKTSTSGKDPQKAHLVNESSTEDPIAPLCVSEKGKLQRWKDLQLPLYVAFVADRYNVPQANVTAAYGNLTASGGTTEVVEWPISDDEMDSAMEWVAAAANRIRAGVFWPPSEEAAKNHYDDFGALAPDGFANAIDSEMVESLCGSEVAQ